MSDTEKPKKKGRPRANIDLDEAEKLGMLHCTLEECSAWMGIPVGTLSKRDDFTEAYKKGKEKGKMSLRRIQFNLAKKNTAMAIWLGKQYLGQREHQAEAEDDPQAKIIMVD